MNNENMNNATEQPVVEQTVQPVQPVAPEVQQPTKKNSNTPLIIIIVLLLLIICGGLVYYFVFMNKDASNNKTDESTTTTTVPVQQYTLKDFAKKIATDVNGLPAINTKVSLVNLMPAGVEDFTAICKSNMTGSFTSGDNTITYTCNEVPYGEETAFEVHFVINDIFKKSIIAGTNDDGTENVYVSGDTYMITVGRAGMIYELHVYNKDQRANTEYYTLPLDEQTTEDDVELTDDEKAFLADVKTFANVNSLDFPITTAYFENDKLYMMESTNTSGKCVINKYDLKNVTNTPEKMLEFNCSKKIED
jgi:hypothetical protein